MNGLQLFKGIWVERFESCHHAIGHPCIAQCGRGATDYFRCWGSEGVWAVHIRGIVGVGPGWKAGWVPGAIWRMIRIVGWDAVPRPSACDTTHQ